MFFFDERTDVIVFFCIDTGYKHLRRTVTVVNIMNAYNASISMFFCNVSNEFKVIVTKKDAKFFENGFSVLTLNMQSIEAKWSLFEATISLLRSKYKT